MENKNNTKVKTKSVTLKAKGKSLTGQPLDSIEINPQLDGRDVAEQSRGGVVLTFGRMNPPTVGHEKLVSKVLATAAANRAVPMVFLSHSQDKNKNPLEYEDKFRFARAAFGATVQKSMAKTIIDIAKSLQSKFKDLTVVVGSDRVQEFDTLLNKYNGKDYSFDKINVVSAGERDPDAEGVEGMSASKMRNAAKAGDKSKFISGLPKRLKSQGDEVMQLTRMGMQLAEELESLESLQIDEVLNVQQRRERGLIMKRYQAKIARAREIAKRKIAPEKNLERRAQMKARDLIRRRVAGQRGQDYDKLSPTEKMQIDVAVSKRKGAINKIAKRLLPKVRSAEYQRLSSFLKGDKMQSLHTPQQEQFNNTFEQYVSQDDYVTVDQILEEMTNLVLDKIITEKQIASLHKKSTRSGIDYDILETVYTRGLLDTYGDSAAAFNRVNAFICGGKTAVNEDADLYQQVERADMNELFEARAGGTAHQRVLAHPAVHSVDDGGRGDYFVNLKKGYHYSGQRSFGNDSASAALKILKHVEAGNVNEETKWVKDKHGSGYTSSDGKREIVKHPRGWISRSTTDAHDYSDVFPTQKEAKAGKYAWAMKNEARAPGTPSVTRYTRPDGSTALKSLNKWGKRKDWRDSEGGLAKAKEHAGLPEEADPAKRLIGTNSLVKAYRKDTPGQSEDINEAFENHSFKMKPGDRTKVLRGDHRGKSGVVVSSHEGGSEYTIKHKDGSEYTIKHKDGSTMRHHISTLDKAMSEDINEDLRKWFDQKWVRMDTKGEIKGDCAREEGEGKPKCLPQAKAQAMDKSDRAKAARRKRREDPVADRQGKGGKPVNVATEAYIIEKNSPTNPALWSRAKALARQKFDVYPSAYANGWAAKWYKSKGGSWKSINESYDVNSKHYKALTDLDLNTKNRDMTTKHDGYGPLNPSDEKGSKAFWDEKAEMWNTTTEAAMEARCGNCAAFNQAPAIMKKMAEGLGPAGEKIQELSDLGFCELFEFKCAGSRTCNKWLVNGPITEEDTSVESKGSKARKKIEVVDRTPPHTEFPRQAQLKHKIIDENSLDESFNIAYGAGIGITLTAADLGMKAQGGFAYHPSVIEDMKKREAAAEPAEEFEEEVRSADVKGVTVRTASGKAVIRKQKANRKIIRSGNLTDGKPNDTV